MAPRVVAVGDPARARFIAGRLLEGARLVSDHRGFHVYTGEYRGVPVSVVVHGIGSASAAIVFEELRMLGARLVVRLGTCGGLREDVAVGDFVVATAASAPPGGALGQYFPGVTPPAAPDPRLTLALEAEARARAPGRVHAGPVFSSDAFYAEGPELARRLASMGFVAVEMEAATLFSLAHLRGFRAAALLVVSDNLVVPGEERLRGHEELEPYVARAAEAVLEALASAEEG